MIVFWEKGYEGASLEDLQEAMGGISPPSFYAAFSSKEALFFETVELYARTIAIRPRAALEAPTARGAVEGFFRASVEIVTGPRTPHSCLLMLGAINCAPANHSIELKMKQLRREGSESLRERIERGVREGDLPEHIAIDALVSLAISFAHGVPIRARDGASRADLLAGLAAFMAAWDAITSQEKEPA
jgi:AcrR family transcriptional regulator